MSRFSLSAHRFAPLVALVLSSACAAGPARWIPPENPGGEGTCSRRRECSGHDHECLKQSRDDWLYCQIDRASQVALASGARQGFDVLAATVLLKEGHCDVGYDAREASHRALLQFYPSVRREIDGAMESGLVDLAVRRAMFVEAVFAASGGELGRPPDQRDVVAKARAFHEREAARVEATLPAAALFHRCSGPWPERCPSFPSAKYVAVHSLAHAADHEVEVRAAAGCEEIRSAALGYPAQKRAGSLRSVKVDIELTQCSAPPDHSETVTVVCHDPPSTTAGARAQPDQGRSLEVRRIMRRYEIHGVARVNDKTTPITISQSAVEVVGPPGCASPGSSEGPLGARNSAMLRLSEAVGRMIGDTIRIQPSELVAAGEIAAGKGDLDRADHDYQLALLATEHGQEDREVRAAAEAWFAKRYGSFSASEPELGRYSNTRIGLAGRYSSTLQEDCH